MDVSSPTANNTVGAGTAFAVSGYYWFKGDGTLTGHDFVSTGDPSAPIIERNYTGTYTVNSDGTGTLQLIFPGSDFSPVGKFTIVESGRAIEIVFIVPGNLNTFQLVKQTTDGD